MKRIYYISIIAATLFAASCELNLVPLDTVSDASFWKTPDDFQFAANNLYGTVLERMPTGQHNRNDDLESDITAAKAANTVSSGRLVPPETSTLWRDSYIAIRNANTMLEKGANATNPQIKRYLGEARFFRAYAYWKLFRLYGGVPLINKVYEPGSEELFAPRASRAETVDFILAELTAAIPDLPLKDQLTAKEAGRITRGAAQAFKARVALFEGTWQKYRNGTNVQHYLDEAIASANDVITGNQYSLFTGKGAESYRYLFIEEGDDSPEGILDRRYERTMLEHDYPYAIDGFGYNATRKLMDMYLDENGLPITHPMTVFKGYTTYSSEYLDRDPRMTQTWAIPGTVFKRPLYPEGIENWPNYPQSVGNTGYITWKFMTEDPLSNSNYARITIYDRHLIRFAEVLLIYAEALFEKNGSISDQDLDKSINLLRARVNMPKLTNAFVTSNGLDMRTELRRERTIELALEGFRYDDLRRWKTAETEMPGDFKGIKIRGNTQWATYPYYADSQFNNKVDANGFLIVETGRKFNPNRDYLHPLPTREIAFYAESGHTLEQNPGW